MATSEITGGRKVDEKVEMTCKREDHYACGCSTTRIETVEGALNVAARCAGHGEPMIKTITTNEYVLIESRAGVSGVQKIRLPRRHYAASQ